MSELPPYKDPLHPGNAIRPRIKCVNCRQFGVITAWGDWCFDCNVERMDRISANLEAEARRYGIEVRG